MTAVRSNGLTFFTYIGIQPLRLIGTPQSGETDGRSLFTTANTAKVFAVTNATQTFVPGNTFSPLQLLTPGRGYAVAGKQSFTLSACFPPSDPSVLTEALEALWDAIGETIVPQPSPSPDPVPNPNPSGNQLIGMNI